MNKAVQKFSDLMTLFVKNVSIFISLIALIISVLNFYTSTSESEIEKKLQAQQLIYSAWDDLGGKQGTEYFDKPVSSVAVSLAKRKIIQALSINKNNPDAKILYGVIQYHSANIKDDRNLMSKAKETLKGILVKKIYKNDSGNIYYVKSLLSLGLLNEAETFLNSIKSDADDFEYLSYDILYAKLWLNLFYLKKDYENVEHYIELLDSIDSDTAIGETVDDNTLSIELRLAAIHYEKNDEKSLKYFLDVLEKKQNSTIINDINPYIHIVITRIYGDQGEFEKALDHFKAAIKLKHDLARGWMNIGEPFGRIAEDSEILSIMENEYKKNPRGAIIVENLGLSYLHLRLYNKAINIFKECLSHFDKNVIIGSSSRLSSCYNKLAGAYFSAGNINEALNYLEQAIRHGVANENTLALQRELVQLVDVQK